MASSCSRGQSSYSQSSSACSCGEPLAPLLMALAVASLSVKPTTCVTPPTWWQTVAASAQKVSSSPAGIESSFCIRAACTSSGHC